MSVWLVIVYASLKNRCTISGLSAVKSRFYLFLNFKIFIDFFRNFAISISEIPINILLIIVLFTSCSIEDNNDSLETKMNFIEDSDEIVLVDIIYVVSSDTKETFMYNLNEKRFIDHLNTNFFHQYQVGLKLGEIKTVVNDELYDLRDNEHSEAATFLAETQKTYSRDRVNIYIIKRSNSTAVKGLGKDQRALITDDFLFTTTAPHEIGHALGLYHVSEEGNIMSQTKPNLRKDFTSPQVMAIKENIHTIKSY